SKGLKILVSLVRFPVVPQPKAAYESRRLFRLLVGERQVKDGVGLAGGVKRSAHRVPWLWDGQGVLSKLFS
ncbi:hypothetical protein, partial [uncultured Alistipes sp.]|uniref:hypothetical protein n=1 Tax=uncultured Alistipes sp. TaxID=538949 RepID=UPI00260A6877